MNGGKNQLGKDLRRKVRGAIRDRTRELEELDREQEIYEKEQKEHEERLQKYENYVRKHKPEYVRSLVDFFSDEDIQKLLEVSGENISLYTVNAYGGRPVYGIYVTGEGLLQHWNERGERKVTPFPPDFDKWMDIFPYGHRCRSGNDDDVIALPELEFTLTSLKEDIKRISKK